MEMPATIKKTKFTERRDSCNRSFSRTSSEQFCLVCVCACEGEGEGGGVVIGDGGEW